MGLPSMGVTPFRRVSIVGVGLVGGSLGLAMRERGVARHVVGIGHRQSSLDRALEVGAVDEATLDVCEGVAGTELTVLATPVGVMEPLVRRAAGSIPRGSIVTDVGSTKGQLVRALETLADGRFHFVGAHPMAGSEKRGVAEARADLFDGALCFLTPTSNTQPHALSAVAELWQEVGARVRITDPAQHDRSVAYASHLPHLAAAALVNVITSEAMECISTGFLSTTRVASGDPRLWADVCLQNRARILEALRGLGNEVQMLRDILERQAETELLGWLETAKAVRDQHLST